MSATVFIVLNVREVDPRWTLRFSLIVAALNVIWNKGGAKHKSVTKE